MYLSTYFSRKGIYSETAELRNAYTEDKKYQGIFKSFYKLLVLLECMGLSISYILTVVQSDTYNLF